MAGTGQGSGVVAPADRMFRAGCGARWRQVHFADGRVRWTEVLQLCGGESPYLPGLTNEQIQRTCDQCAPIQKHLQDRESGI